MESTVKWNHEANTLSGLMGLEFEAYKSVLSDAIDLVEVGKIEDITDSGLAALTLRYFQDMNLDKALIGVALQAQYPDQDLDTTARTSEMLVNTMKGKPREFFIKGIVSSLTEAKLSEISGIEGILSAILNGR